MDVVCKINDRTCMYISICIIVPNNNILVYNSDVYCIFVTFPCSILDQVWYLSVSFLDLWHLSYFAVKLAEVNSIKHQYDRCLQ